MRYSAQAHNVDVQAAATLRPTAEKNNRDERVAIPLDAEEALRALLKVDPESEPPESPLELAEAALARAEGEFQRVPSDANDRRVQQARSLVRSEQERERKSGGPIRPPARS